MSILDQLGLDPDSFTWHDLALCDGTDNPDWFYDEYERNTNVAKTVDQMCLSCPVMQQCARVGQENREVGVWGGIYWNGSGKPDKARNAHKTDEVWLEIRDRLSE